MKKTLVSFTVFLFVFLAACNNAGKKDNDQLSSEKLKAQAESLYKEFLKEHEAGMNGWMQIEGRQKQIKTLLDSFASHPVKNQSTLVSYKSKLKEANADLGNAYEKMNTWMKEMNPDSAENNVELRIQYLTNEKMKGSNITALINNSIQKADSLLKIKF
jgi:uncharacterized UPF0160 family protein